MTITLNHIEAQQTPAAPHDAGDPLATLHDTLDAVSWIDADLLHSHTPAGRAVVAIAAAARTAAAALGADAGAPLRSAPGVVVARDLAAAVTLLERAVARHGASLEPLAAQQLTRRTNTAYGQLLLSLPAAT